MPQDLKDFPRPPNDNGRGLHGSFDPTWNGEPEGYDYWINLLTEMKIKWFKVLDDRGSSIPFCEKLLAAGIFPIVRILRRDPPPNDTPEPNPGHLGAPEEETIKQLVSLGVRYFETNNEPDLTREWKHNAIPANPLEAAKLVALNWLFDARVILSLGGLPGLPAISNGGAMDLMGALVALGRHTILQDGCWIAIHNYSQNRPLNYPDDPINRAGQMLTPEEYAYDPFTQWTWWDTARGQADNIDEINARRANGANPAPDLAHDHACFREFEYYNSLAMKYLGQSIPIIGTEAGYRVGRREDLRYPRITPTMHCEQTVALFDFMQRQAPDYLFAVTPTVLIPSDDREPEAWHCDFWRRAFRDAPFGYEAIPMLTVPNAEIGDCLPVIEAVKAMQNLARRMPGTQPLPPVEPTLPIQGKPAPAKIETPATAAPADFPFWLRDEPVTVPAEKIAPPPPPIVERSPEPPPPPIETKPAMPTMPPPPAPEHVAPLTTFELPPLPEDLEWDWRLDALGVSVEPAQVRPGQAYWKLVRAEYEGPGESNDTHQIFYRVVDQHNKPMEYQKVFQSWGDGQTDAITNEAGETNIPIWASYAPDRDERGPYSAWIDGLPSDRVTGMGLPQKHHVSFRLTWKRSIGGFLNPGS
jgi:hypothetical protein